MTGRDVGAAGAGRRGQAGGDARHRARARPGRRRARARAYSRTPAATRSSAAPRRRFQASLDDNRHFGGDPVVILIREPLTDLVETKDLATVSQLEACLAGQVVVAEPAARGVHAGAGGIATPYGGWGSPCGKLMKARPAQVVYGPGTFLNRAVAAVNTEVAGRSRTRAQQAVQTAKTGAYKLALARHMSKQQALAARERGGPDRPAAADDEPAPDVPELRASRASRRSTTRSSSPRSCSTRRAA